MISSGELCQFDENLVCVKCGFSVVADILPVYRKCGPPYYPEKSDFSVDVDAPSLFSLDSSVPDSMDRSFPCRHRGGVSYTTGCGGCGLRTEVADVYTCDLHGLCTIHAKAIRTDGPRSPLVAVCISCPERPIDGT